MATTKEKYCNSQGAAYYQSLVRQYGYKSYVFDTTGRDEIKTIVQTHDPYDFDGVDHDIRVSARKRGDSFHNRMEIMKERENQRYNLNMPKTKNVNAIREYDAMYDVPGSIDLNREAYSQRHREHLAEMDAYERSQAMTSYYEDLSD